jgi:acetyl esterase
MTDYDSLIDAETWGFIRATAAAYPADGGGPTIAGQRAAYDAMCALFRAPRPPGLAVRDAPVAGVPCRHYGAGPATVLWLHGGGFVLGGLDSHDDICAELAAATGLGVVSADYRLAPEHPHPAAYQDALAVAGALLEAGPVVLAGDSAGGALAASVAHALRGHARLRGQLLVYPALGGDTDRGSFVTHAEAPMLTRADMLQYDRLRHGGTPPARDPTASALHDTDFAGLPPTVIVTAECDPLSDDGRDYRDAILAAGGQAVWLCETGLVHGYLRARHSVAPARASFARITAAASALARGALPPY